MPNFRRKGLLYAALPKMAHYSVLIEKWHECHLRKRKDFSYFQLHGLVISNAAFCYLWHSLRGHGYVGGNSRTATALLDPANDPAPTIDLT
jgi:hypothetical protein